jgi:TRAP-type C4-dicarboxylate transport system permease small subunit
VTKKLGILSFANRMNNVIESVVSYLAGFTFFAVTILAIVEIVRRYLLGVTFEWGQDAAIYSVVVAVVLYFSVTQIRRGHLVMAAAIEYLNHKQCYRIVGLSKIVATTLTAALCLSLGYSGWSMVTYAYSINLKSESLVLDLWPFYFFFVLGISLMGLVAFFQIIEDVVAYRNGDHLKGEIDMVADI